MSYIPHSIHKPANRLETKATACEYKDLLPVMAEKLDGDTFVSELCGGFRLLADCNRFDYTRESEEELGAPGHGGDEQRRFRRDGERRRPRRRRSTQ